MLEAPDQGPVKRLMKAPSPHGTAFGVGVGFAAGVGRDPDGDAEESEETRR